MTDRPHIEIPRGVERIRPSHHEINSLVTGHILIGLAAAANLWLLLAHGRAIGMTAAILAYVAAWWAEGTIAHYTSRKIAMPNRAVLVVGLCYVLCVALTAIAWVHALRVGAQLSG